jgi:hypothetical protein
MHKGGGRFSTAVEIPVHNTLFNQVSEVKPLLSRAVGTPEISLSTVRVTHTDMCKTYSFSGLPVTFLHTFLDFSSLVRRAVKNLGRNGE